MNVLLNKLSEQRIKNIKFQSGSHINELTEILLLNKDIKELEKNLVDLTLNKTANLLKSPIRLNPFSSYFMQRSINERSILVDAYESVPINNEVIEEIKHLKNSESNKLTELLLNLREKETALTLEKQIGEYENESLHAILMDCIKRIDSIEIVIHDALAKFEMKFKYNIFEVLKVLSIITNRI